MSAASIYAEAMTVECPYCGEARTYPCVTKPYGVRASRPHQPRLDAAARVRRAASPLPGGKEGK